MIFSGAAISAEEAARIGLVDEVVTSPEDLDPALQRWFKLIEPASPHAITRAKRSLLQKDEIGEFGQVFQLLGREGGHHGPSSKSARPPGSRRTRAEPIARGLFAWPAASDRRRGPVFFPAFSRYASPVRSNTTSTTPDCPLHGRFKQVRITQQVDPPRLQPTVGLCRRHELIGVVRSQRKLLPPPIGRPAALHLKHPLDAAATRRLVWWRHHRPRCPYERLFRATRSTWHARPPSRPPP